MQLGDIVCKAKIRSAESQIPLSDFLYVIGAQLGLSNTELILKQELPISASLEHSINQAFNRLQSHEPPQYISGSAAFHHLNLHVNPAVLIPRPETEGLVEIALRYLHDGMRVLDIGTGSGAIAIALKSMNQSLQIDAVDVSDTALSVAINNARLYGLNINFYLSDLFPSTTQKYDAIISNPPYITATEMKELEPKVRENEPHLALFGGEDGLDFYRRIMAKAGDFLNARGFIALEHGAYQKDAIQAIANQFGWYNIEAHKDLQGRDRYQIIFATDRVNNN